MNANVKRLAELIAMGRLPALPQETCYSLACWLARNGVLSVNTLTDDQCYELSDGQHKATRPGWNMRDDLEAIAKGETP